MPIHLSPSMYVTGLNYQPTSWCRMGTRPSVDFCGCNQDEHLNLILHKDGGYCSLTHLKFRIFVSGDL